VARTACWLQIHCPQLVRVSARGPAPTSPLPRPRPWFLTTYDVVTALGVDAETASRSCPGGRQKVGFGAPGATFYIPVPLDASNPAAWSEDALVVATAVWPPVIITGWTGRNHWALTDQLFRTTVVKTGWARPCIVGTCPRSRLPS